VAWTSQKIGCEDRLQSNAELCRVGHERICVCVCWIPVCPQHM